MLLPRPRWKLARGAKGKEHAMSPTLKTAIAVVGIDIGKNSFHVVGLDQRGAIVLRAASVAWAQAVSTSLLASKTGLPVCMETTASMAALTPS